MLNIKIFISIALNIWLPNNPIVYVITIGAINLIINLAFVFNIVYEHPKIEYLCLLTQFYMWLPCLSFLFSFVHGNPTSTFIIMTLSLILYIGLTLTKPKELMMLL